MDRCVTCIHVMASEKLIDELTFKIGPDQKRRLVALAEADGLNASELVRRLVTAHLDERERHFRALSLIFGQDAVSDKT